MASLTPPIILKTLADDEEERLFHVVGLTAYEAVSRLYSIQLDLLAPNQKKVNFANVLARLACVVIRTPPDQSNNPIRERVFAGICSRFSQGETDDRFTSYRMEIVPHEWMLTRRAQSRIFQQVTVIDILQIVLGLKNPIPTTMMPFDQAKFPFKKRNYCVQYRETDFNFASRLMEEEGIYYSFWHQTDNFETGRGSGQSPGYSHLTLADARTHRQAPAFFPPLTYKAVQGGQAELETIFQWEKTQEVRSREYHLRDFSFQLPSQFLDDKARLRSGPNGGLMVGQVEHPTDLDRSSGIGKFDIQDYPGAFAQHFDGVDQGGGDRPQDLKDIFDEPIRTAQIRANQEAMPMIVIRGSSTIPSLNPGYSFHLKTMGTSRQAAQLKQCEGPYTITAVTHFARQSPPMSGGVTSFHYQNRFECIPLALPLQPARVTPKPVIQGTQTAVVVGHADQEITTDRHGRVKVKFHWDRDERKNADSSCWIRVSQPWAGRRWGASFWPRIGQEVIVSFLEGDPDKPIIVGCVYNSEQRPPYLHDGDDPAHSNDNKVSGIKTCSTPGGNGFNEIRFDDTKGKEQLFLRAQSAMDVHVGGDQRTSVGGSQHLTVGFEDEHGNKHGVLSEKAFAAKVSTIEGVSFTWVGDAHVLSVGKAGEYRAHIKDGDYVSLAEEQHAFVSPGIRLEAKSFIKLVCGDSVIVVLPNSIVIKSAQVEINPPRPIPNVPTENATVNKPEAPAAADDSKTGYPSRMAPPPAQPSTNGKKTASLQPLR